MGVTAFLSHSLTPRGFFLPETSELTRHKSSTSAVFGSNKFPLLHDRQPKARAGAGTVRSEQKDWKVEWWVTVGPKADIYLLSNQKT